MCRIHWHASEDLCTYWAGEWLTAHTGSLVWVRYEIPHSFGFRIEYFCRTCLRSSPNIPISEIVTLYDFTSGPRKSCSPSEAQVSPWPPGEECI